jgi:transcriptional regulator with XRE-family HTH domain
MPIPPNLVLSADDIRYLRHSQLAQLTGIDASSFSAWSQQRRFSERTLDQLAHLLGTPKTVILEGFDLRRQDVATARLAQHKAEQLIAFLNRNTQQESA